MCVYTKRIIKMKTCNKKKHQIVYHTRRRVYFGYENERLSSISNQLLHRVCVLYLVCDV